jgi:hypothetical protein
MSGYRAYNRMPDQIVIILIRRATFVSSPEGGTEKSCVFSLVCWWQVNDLLARVNYGTAKFNAEIAHYFVAPPHRAN